MMTIHITYDSGTSLKLATAFDPRSVAERWASAVNGGDIDTIEAMLSDHVVLVANGSGASHSEIAELRISVGKEDVTSWFADIANQNTRLTLSNTSVEGFDVARFEASITSDSYTEAGVTPPPLIATVEIDVGFEAKINSITYAFDESSVQRLALSRMSPEALVTAYLQAFNAGDIEALVPLYADDVVFSYGPFLFGGEDEFDTFTGKLEVMADEFQSIADHAQITFSGLTIVDDTVKGELSYVDDFVATIGVLTGTLEVTLGGGRITNLELRFDEATQQRFAARFTAPAGPPPQPGEVTFTAVDIARLYQLRGPDSVPAGWTPVRLDSGQAKEPHHLQFIRLAEGKTVEDLFAVLGGEGPPGPLRPLPDWAQSAGGVGDLFPGGSGIATINLEEGEYVLGSFIGTEEGATQFERGMFKTLTVTAATDPLSEPEADVTVDMFESGYTISAPITAGVHTIRVTNSGQRAHSAVVASVPPDAPAEDFRTLFAFGRPIGGLATIEAGDHAYFTAVFAPGKYVLFSLAAGEASGTPDYVLGMIQEFTVE